MVLKINDRVMTNDQLARAGKYPVRVLESNGRFKVSKFDLLNYLGAVPQHT